jgi:hypothetical protein
MEMRNFGHMLGHRNQLKRDPLAMTTRGEPPPFYHRDLVWHLSVNGIMGNTVHARLGDNLARFEFLGHALLLVVAFLRKQGDG